MAFQQISDDAFWGMNREELRRRHQEILWRKRQEKRREMGLSEDEEDVEGRPGNEVLGGWVEEEDIWKDRGMEKGFWTGGGRREYE